MNIALIMAAGKGTRINSSIPKQFLLINDKPLICYTLDIFQNHSSIDEIVIVTKEEYVLTMEDLCKKYIYSKVKLIIKGGSSRQESVYLGLKSLKQIQIKDEDIILIHDAARALVSEKIIAQNIEGCKKFSAVTTALRISDTVVKSKDSTYIDTYLNRDELFEVQTPQTFKYYLILKAHESFKNQVTDDSSLVQKIHPISIIDGSRMNFKITYLEDIELFKKLLNKN